MTSRSFYHYEWHTSLYSGTQRSYWLAQQAARDRFLSRLTEQHPPRYIAKFHDPYLLWRSLRNPPTSSASLIAASVGWRVISGITMHTHEPTESLLPCRLEIDVCVAVSRILLPQERSLQWSKWLVCRSYACRSQSLLLGVLHGLAKRKQLLGPSMSVCLPACLSRGGSTCMHDRGSLVFTGI
jgi:hypothetical protein